MLIIYFLKKFYKNFIILLFSLMLIFSASDMLVRLPTILSFKATPLILLLMFPLMAQFAIPISSALAVQMVIGKLYLDQEIVLIYFLYDAKKALYKATLLFSVSILFLYIPIVTFWAPKSYKMGKEYILNLAKEQFFHLETNKFHKIASGFTFFFKKKNNNKNDLKFYKILLMFKEKNGQNYLANAQKGILKNNILILKNGVMQNMGTKKTYIANFEKTKLDLNKFLVSKNGNFKVKDLKFFTFQELIKKMKNSFLAKIEFHKRIAQIIWQIIFPFLALFSIMLFAKPKSNLLISIFLSGVLFLISYLFLNLARALSINYFFTIILIYLPIILVSWILYHFYLKKS